MVMVCPSEFGEAVSERSNHRQANIRTHVSANCPGALSLTANGLAGFRVEEVGVFDVDGDLHGVAGADL